jgi:hypothetical protein
MELGPVLQVLPLLKYWQWVVAAAADLMVVVVVAPED